MNTFLKQLACIVTGSLLYTGTTAAAPLLEWSLQRTYPHDKNHFTQGLIWDSGKIIESVGQYGESKITIKDLKTGKTLKQRKLAGDEFGEGLTRIGNEYLQLTWQEGVVYRYNPQLKLIRVDDYFREGWGATTDGKSLITSDGSESIFFMDPKTFQILREIKVHDGNEIIEKINELEWIDGMIYANIWMSDKVARIDPKDGSVTGWIDFSSLKTAVNLTEADIEKGAVLNGLAWRPDTQQLLVTGKYWRSLFAVSLPVEAKVPAAAAAPAEPAPTAPPPVTQ